MKKKYHGVNENITLGVNKNSQTRADKFGNIESRTGYLLYFAGHLILARASVLVSVW